MSKPISDYALIGDTHSCALIARDGSIDWLCWPRHDSPALFVKLLDDEKGGACSVAFDDLTASDRRYMPDTNILETTFTTATGRARLVDVMPVNPPSPEPEEGPDGEGESRLIRLLTCESGTCGGMLRGAADLRLCAPPVHAAGGGRLRAVRGGRLARAGQRAAAARDRRRRGRDAGSACPRARPPIWSSPTARTTRTPASTISTAPGAAWRRRPITGAAGAPAAPIAEPTATR